MPPELPEPSLASLTVRQLTPRVLSGVLLGLAWASNAFAAQGNFGLDDAASSAGYKTGNVQIPTVIGAVLQALFGLIAILFFGMMLYAGYNWMTAMGDSEKVTKAKDTIISAIIGIIIIIAAYAITMFVINNVASTTT